MSMNKIKYNVNEKWMAKSQLENEARQIVLSNEQGKATSSFYTLFLNV